MDPGSLKVRDLAQQPITAGQHWETMPILAELEASGFHITEILEFCMPGYRLSLDALSAFFLLVSISFYH